MQLDVRKIIDIPGASIPFEYELCGDNLEFPSISTYKQIPKAHGRIYNEAGVLRMTGEIETEMVCICDRCGTMFERSKTTKVDVILAEEESEDNPDLFALQGETVDLDEVLSSCFIMDMDMKVLCSLYLSSFWINKKILSCSEQLKCRRCQYGSPKGKSIKTEKR